MALNHQYTKKDPQRITKIKPFIDQYDWSEIEFPSHQKDWKKFELNNKTIALNVLFIPYDAKQIRPTYISKYNSSRKKQVILLMINDNDKKWHYLFIKELSALVNRITSKHNGDFCLNCFYSFRIENVLKKRENICKDYGHCCVEMPDKDNNILKYNSGEKYMSIPFVMYVDKSVCLKILVVAIMILINHQQSK